MEHKYNEEIITMDMAKVRAAGYPFALVYKISEVYLGETAGIEDPWDELLEARFFSKEGELHIFRCEKEWKAVEFIDNGSNENNENIRMRRYGLTKRFMSSGRYLLVKDYLADDADGQVYVEQTRLCGIEGAKTDE